MSMRISAGFAALTAILYVTAAGAAPHPASTGTTGKAIDDGGAVVVAQTKSRGGKRVAPHVQQKPKARKKPGAEKGTDPKAGILLEEKGTDPKAGILLEEKGTDPKAFSRIDFLSRGQKPGREGTDPKAVNQSGVITKPKGANDPAPKQPDRKITKPKGKR